MSRKQFQTEAPGFDPITLELVAGTVESARREMELQIERTARSVVIREGRDYRAGIFDRHGRNVSSASGAAHVDPILQNYERDQIHDGDVFIWNDPFKSAGGLTHLPDLCITQPIFWQGELVGYVQAFGHMTDVGGLQPGSVMIGATDIHQEGIIIPPVKLYSRGEVVEPLYRTILNNSRYPACRPSHGASRAAARGPAPDTCSIPKPIRNRSLNARSTLCRLNREPACSPLRRAAAVGEIRWNVAPGPWLKTWDWVG